MSAQIRIVLLLLAVVACSPAPAPVISPATPQRVVSFIPSVTELLFAVGAGPKVVGVTVHDDYPAQVKDLPRVYETSPDYDRLAALMPDLVVRDSSINKPGELEKLAALGIPVLSIHCQRLGQIPESLRAIGKSLGEARVGEAAAVSFERELEELGQIEGQCTVLIEVWGSPLTAAGGATVPHDAVESLGARNYFRDQEGYFQVVQETLAQNPPDVILLPLQEAHQESAAAEFLATLELDVPVIKIPADLITKPTPRVLEGMKLLKEKLTQIDDS